MGSSGKRARGSRDQETNGEKRDGGESEAFRDRSILGARYAAWRRGLAVTW